MRWRVLQASSVVAAMAGWLFLLTPATALAANATANATYAWKNANAITVSGPDIATPVDLKNNPGGTGGGTGYGGVVHYVPKNCDISIHLDNVQPGATSATVANSVSDQAVLAYEKQDPQFKTVCEPAHDGKTAKYPADAFNGTVQLQNPGGSTPGGGSEDPSTQKIFVTYHPNSNVTQNTDVSGVNPQTVDILLTGPNGYSETKSATAGAAISGLVYSTEFDDAKTPGDYKACVKLPSNACQTGHRDVGFTTSIIIEDPNTTINVAGADSGQKCSDNSGNFSWIICPAIETINKFLGFLYNKFILPELQLSPLTNSAANQQLKDVWSAMKDLANVAFVLIFLVIIFANVMSLNIDNYTIKKMLPRLVAAGVIVQFSWFLCGFIVDIGNVLGDGIGSLIDAVLSSGAPAGSGPGGVQSLVSHFAVFGAIGLATVGFALLAGPVLLTLFVGFLLALLAFVLALLFRHILIAVLIVMSPIALAAWVLPNTEKLFKLWYTNLIKVVMMYPIVVLILAGGRIVASVGSADPNAGELNQALALLAPMISFFLIPASFKWAGSAMGSIAGVVRGGAVGARGAARKRIGESDWAAEQKLKSASRRQRVVGAIPQFGQNQQVPIVGGALRRLGQAPRSVAGFALATPASEVGRQRTLNQTVGKLKERFDTLNVNGQELAAIIDDPKRSREERLAALQRKAETAGLDSGDKAKMAALAPKGMGAMYERAAMSGSAFSKTKETSPREAYTHINPDGTTSFDQAGFEKAMSPSALPKIKPEALQELIGSGLIPATMAQTALGTAGIKGQMSGRTEELLQQLVNQGQREMTHERIGEAVESVGGAPVAPEPPTAPPPPSTGGGGEEG